MGTLNRLVLAGILLMGPGMLLAEEQRVTTANWVFHPKEIVIKSGDRVTWFNDDDTMHNIYFEDESLKAPLEGKPHNIRVKKSFSFDFTKAGEYIYHCKNHKSYGMSGKIVVE